MKRSLRDLLTSWRSATFNPRDAAELVIQLDLSFVRARLKKEGWNQERLDHGEQEYRDFLILLAQNPGQRLVPWCQTLDEFWHAHILHTRRYMQDCQRIFGRYLHHDPEIERNPEVYRTAVDTTKSLLEE